MNVAINLLELPPNRTEGVSTYVFKLISRIKSSEKNKFIVLAQEGLKIPFPYDERIHTIYLPKKNTVAYRLLRKLRLRPSKEAALSGILNKYGIDVVHYPLGAIPPEDFNLQVKILLSVMDLQHEYFPNFFSKEQLYARRASHETSCLRADKIIAISEFTKSSIVDKYHIKPHKIKVVYLAGDLSDKVKPIELPDNFLFYPAATWEHKNHIALLEALERLIESKKFDGKLVLTGVRTEYYTKVLNRIISLGLEQRVLHLGQVPYEALPYIYSSAKAVIFPSLFEGFGIPIAEAMQLGIPVACSNTTSLPEVAGNAAIMFNPRNSLSIAKAIDSVWNNSDLREKLRKRGPRQAKKFAWDKTAEETVRIYEDLVYGK